MSLQPTTPGSFPTLDPDIELDSPTTVVEIPTGLPWYRLIVPRVHMLQDMADGLPAGSTADDRLGQLHDIYDIMDNVRYTVQRGDSSVDHSMSPREGNRSTDLSAFKRDLDGFEKILEGFVEEGGMEQRNPYPEVFRARRPVIFQPLNAEDEAMRTSIKGAMSLLNRFVALAAGDEYTHFSAKVYDAILEDDLQEADDEITEASSPDLFVPPAQKKEMEDTYNALTEQRDQLHSYQTAGCTGTMPSVLKDFILSRVASAKETIEQMTQVGRTLGVPGIAAAATVRSDESERMKASMSGVFGEDLSDDDVQMIMSKNRKISKSRRNRSISTSQWSPTLRALGPQAGSSVAKHSRHGSTLSATDARRTGRVSSFGTPPSAASPMGLDAPDPLENFEDLQLTDLRSFPPPTSHPRS